MPRFDVFLSYHWRDRDAVETIAQWLRGRGVSVFLDRWYLAAGQPWPSALEQALGACGAVAVCLGPEGMGAWQQRESWLALDRQSRTPGFPVVPLLLPGAEPALGFLSLNTWIDLRHGLTDPLALEGLASAIRGEPPGADLAERVRQTLAAICPYRGLRPFREEDEPFFFGREAYIDRLAQAVDRLKLIAVVGASGSGKSSLARAGLVSRLRRERAGTTWEIATLLPGERPLHALAAGLVPLLEPAMTETDRLAEVGKLAGHLMAGDVALRDVVQRVLAKQPGTDRLLLIADQWEELYTQTRDDATRRRFIDQLLDACAAVPLTVVLTLRGDFFGQALSYRVLADRLQDSVVNLGPMNREELERAVCRPAERTGLVFERGLAERILDDVGDEPGNLPLLEFVLAGLWEVRRGGQLLHEAYDAMGRLEGAVAQRAEEEYGRLVPLEQDAARRIFLQLVRAGEGTQDTRRRAAIGEVDEPARPVVRKLADARLLVTARDAAAGGETVELSHEALIGHWGRLRGWLDQDREFLLWHQRLRGAVEQWERSGQDEGALLQGALLAEAERWAGERGADLTAPERDFVARCLTIRARREEAERERRVRELAQAQALAEEQRARAEAEGQRAADQARSRKRLRAFSWLLSVALVVAIALGAYGWVKRAEAQRQTTVSLSMQLAAQAQALADPPSTALLLAVEGFNTLPTVEARASMLAVVERYRHLSTNLWSDGGTVASVAFSPDGKTLATGSDDTTVRLWDLEKKHQASATLTGHEGSVTSIAFSPDGKMLATGSHDETVRLWDVKKRQGLATLAGHEDSVIGVAFAPDGKTLATASGDTTVRLWDVETRQAAGILNSESSVTSVAFSPEGKTLATGSDDAMVRLWDWEKKGHAPATLTGHGGSVASIAFSRDGKTLATGSDDTTVRLWDLERRQALATLTGHEGPVASVAFSRDGKTLATGSDDRTVRLWDVENRQALVTLRGHESRVNSVAFSPDGKTVATGSGDRTLRLWDVDASSWKRTACQMANRNLTPQEWRQYVGAGRTARFLVLPTANAIARWQSADLAAYSRTCEELPIHPGLIDEGRALARGGEREAALAVLKRVRELDPNALGDVEREVGAHGAAGRSDRTLDEGIKLLREGKPEQAMSRFSEAGAAYAEALGLQPDLPPRANSVYMLCLMGAIWGDASKVMQSCDSAVKLDKGRLLFRGIARARAGDRAGALADLEAAAPEWRSDEDVAPMLHRWIEALRANREPLTVDDIESLKKLTHDLSMEPIWYLR